jgi:hypothetical protein
MSSVDVKRVRLLEETQDAGANWTIAAQLDLQGMVEVKLGIFGDVIV